MHVIRTGFVGLWNLILMWPVFFILHFTNIEEFELPNQQQFLVLLINGLVGTVLSEALWLWYDKSAERPIDRNLIQCTQLTYFIYIGAVS